MATSSRCRAVAACARFCGAAARGGGSGAGGGPSYALNLTHGRTHYRPSGSYGYGGNGVLLSRGLLDAIPEHAWQLCARRLVCGSSDFRLCMRLIRGMNTLDSASGAYDTSETSGCDLVERAARLRA